jgi:hypothetical protein
VPARQLDPAAVEAEDREAAVRDRDVALHARAAELARLDQHVLEPRDRVVVVVAVGGIGGAAGFFERAVPADDRVGLLVADEPVPQTRVAL